MSITAIILTKNEEENIAKCLTSLSFADEMLIIDDSSTDKTVEIAKGHGARVLEHALNGDFASARNFALEKAKGEWILFVDADEVVSGDLKNEILHCVENDNNMQGYYLKRQDYMWGKALQHGEQGNTVFLRLGKKESGEWTGKVHEVWDIKRATGRLENPLLHYPHPTVAAYLQSINFYSTLRAEELHKKGKKVSWIDVLLYPKAKFVQDFFLKLGFLDGVEGFIVAILMSFHSFLVRGKLWQLSKN